MATKLQCEICGGKLVGKPGGIFECESCGTEYSTEWAKAKIQEITGTVKVEGTVEVTGKVQVEGGTVQVDTSANKNALMKRAFLLVEERNWEKADAVLDQVLNMDPENSEAYLGKLLVEKKVSNRSHLKNVSLNLGSSVYFHKVCRFGDDALRKELSGIVFDKASELLDSGESQKILMAKQMFSAIESLCNVSDKIAECEAHLKANEDAKHRDREERYNHAIELMRGTNRTAEDLEEAEKIFRSVLLFNDSKQKIEECSTLRKDMIYGEAMEAMDRSGHTIDDLDKAKEKLLSISSWKDAKQKTIECDVLKAKIIARSIRARDGGKSLDELRSELAALEGLKPTFEATLAEKASLESTIRELNERITALENKKRSLGMFKGKEKRAADEEIRSADAEKNRQLAALKTINDRTQGIDSAEQLEKQITEKRTEIERKKALIPYEQAVELYGDASIRKYVVPELAKKEVISASDNTVAVRNDGTVAAVGANIRGQCNVSNWTNIKSVHACQAHTLGIREDGTVVAVGYSEEGQCNVSEWKDIIAVASKGFFSVGLRSNGSVVATGKNNFGQCEVSKWRGIVAITAGIFHTVGLKLDGTVMYAGHDNNVRNVLATWKNIVAIDANGSNTVGLKSNGTVLVVMGTGGINKGQGNVSGWRDIVSVAAGNSHTVGLKSDGTVVAVGENAYGQCNVSGWKDIIAITAGDNHTIGMKADGTLVATGSNTSGECNVSGWRNIKMPEW